jgi:NDP-sugar pyrophosphorylase family protein
MSGAPYFADMKAMLLAAGLGTRLKPFTNHHPKALAPVNGQPLLERNVRYLQSFGITNVVVNVHHFAEQIIELVEQENGWGSHVVISHETGAEPLETGGGLAFARHLLAGSEPVLVMNADILTNLNIHTLVAAHHNDHLATLAVTNRISSRVLLFNENLVLKGWRNNLSGALKGNVTEDNHLHLRAMAFSGVQVLSQSFLDGLLPGRYSTIDQFVQLAHTGLIKGFDHSGDLLLDCGKPESLEKAALLFA